MSESEATPASVPLPSRTQRVFTPGNILAFAVTLGVVYYGWGMVFVPGGTGSNVVLGLLLALAVVYLLTANLGPFFDMTFFHGGSPALAQARRSLVMAIEDFERMAKRAAKGKTKGVKANAAGELRAIADDLRRTWSETVGAADLDKATKTIHEALDAADIRATRLLGEKNTGVLAQLRSLGLALLVALALRAFVVEPFQIPSGSMIPTLLVGDHLFVARYMYGVSKPMAKEPEYLARWAVPQPGDVVVFVAPPYVMSNAGEDWIKRVIAGPGQRVRVEEDVLYVDDKPYSHVFGPEKVSYLDYDDLSRRWRKTRARHRREVVLTKDGEQHEHSIYHSSSMSQDWPAGAIRLEGLTCDERECVVNDDHIFVMGDNRNNSNDGRRWGAVPIDNVKGKALFIWMSVDGSERSIDMGRFTLPKFRWDRLFQSIE